MAAASLALLLASGVAAAGSDEVTPQAKAQFNKRMLPGFVRLDRGGVVRIAELQSQGYVYLRP
jgi:intracellular sulfur oxidation DsrE/DsrF family protein